MTPNTTLFQVLIINSMILYSSFFTFICDFGSKTAVKPVEIPSTSAQTLEVISSLPGRENTKDMRIQHTRKLHYISAQIIHVKYTVGHLLGIFWSIFMCF